MHLRLFDALVVVWSSLLLLQVSCQQRLSAKQVNHTHSIILHIIRTHQEHLEKPLVENELFCRCTVDGCDSELVHLGGEAVRGMCRARGGVCRQSVIASDDGPLKPVMDCVPPERLQPPNRPFACENVKSPNSKDYVLCCNQTSFCNDFDVPVPKPKHILESRDSNDWPWLVVVFVVACVFSFAGLLVGIFWFKSPHSKDCMRTLSACLPGSQNAMAFYAMNSGLNRLLDDIEANMKPMEAQAPVLARRTIARQIRLKEAIARGRFGDVWLGEWRGEKVAVKIFQSRDEHSWRRETDIYSTNMLRHSNLLRWIASDNKDAGSSTQLWLITEYLSRGSLCDYLDANTLSLTEAVQFVRSLAHGLSYLHAEVPGVSDQCCEFGGCFSICADKPGIAHRDLKSRNILVKNDMTLAIADLGLAAKNHRGHLDVPDNGRGGTVRYLAPEYLDGSLLAHRFVAYLNMDMYAFGLVVWEVLRRSRTTHKKELPPSQVPYFEFVQREPSVEEMKQCVCVQKQRPTLLDEWSSNKLARELQRIMTECWAEQASSRLTALNVRTSLDKLVEHEGMKIMT